MDMVYDIAFLGHYTKDTIVSAEGTRVVDGGAFNYGSHAAVRMGLKVAAITRLAQEDVKVADELKALGVAVFAKVTPHSTCLRLDYPTSNVDDRILYVTSSAGPFTIAEVKDISSRAFVVGASVRGEVPLAVIEELRKKDAVIAIDLQGFLRVVQDGRMVFQDWPEKEKVLSQGGYREDRCRGGRISHGAEGHAGCGQTNRRPGSERGGADPPGWGAGVRRESFL